MGWLGRLCLAGVLVVACTSSGEDPRRGGGNLDDRVLADPSVAADASVGFEPPAGTPLPPSVDPIGGVEAIPAPDAAADQTDGPIAVTGPFPFVLPRDAGAREVRARDAAETIDVAPDSSFAGAAVIAAGVFGAGGSAGGVGTSDVAGAGGTAAVPPSPSVQAAVGQAGTTGAAGRTGAANDPCPQLERDYAAALAQALACDFFALGPTCQQNADTSLSCPACKVAVQDPSGLVALSDQWQASGCASRPRDCPAIVCANLAHGICVPSGSGGICDGVTAVMLAPGSSR